MSAEQHYLRVISGQSRGPLAAAARVGLAALSPAYAGAARLRNALFDGGWRRSLALPRPTVSVGNITVGGTGKTPVVAWLAAALRERGLRPAVLMRGYKARPGEKGDEQELLEELLGDAVPVEADADRTRGARRALARAAVDVFLLDDGFQHRRLRRAVDLVLIDATRPFGFGRVLPRGLLREPLEGLRRATAFLVTRAGLVGPPEVERVRGTLASWSGAPVFECDFALNQFDAVGVPAVSDMGGRRVLAASGIGNPSAFEQSIRRLGGEVVAAVAFSDHHHYTLADAGVIAGRARAAGAEAVVVTAKDWVKLRALWGEALGPLYVARQAVRFAEGHDAALLSLVTQRLSDDRGSRGDRAG